jgi:hypothetical protein
MRLKSEYDFLEEGWRSFGSHLEALQGKGGDPAETMCFVWYVLDPASETDR